MARIGLQPTRASFLGPSLRGPTALVYTTKPSLFDGDRYGQKAMVKVAKPAADTGDVLFVAASLDGVLITRDDLKAMKTSPTPDQQLATALSSFPFYSIPRYAESHAHDMVRALQFHVERLEKAEDAPPAQGLPA